jgi:hypothetical protein
LQDRIEDGLAPSPRSIAAQSHEALQFDYLQPTLCFFTGDTQKARELAERYKDYPVPHWQKRFADVLAQLDEAEGKSTPSVANPPPTLSPPPHLRSNSRSRPRT